MINEKQEQLRQELYQQWISHPITAMLIANLRKDKDFFVDKISSVATDPTESDLRVRYYGFGIKNITNIISMITDYAKFTKYQPATKQE